MPRRHLMLFLALVITAVLVPTGAAMAGGGCHDGPSQGSGDTVEMKDACFTPSTLRVERGTTVTFINRDDFDHNVSGMAWGEYGSMRTGDRVSVAFDDEGVYAYACTLHQGMTGSIVVGDGEGPGDGAMVVASDDGPADTAAVAQPVETEEGSWLVPAVIALVVGVALGFGLATARRRPRDDVAATTDHVPSAT